MISFRFLLQALTTPWVVVRTIAQFYTIGTIYSRTDREFKNSLRKNLYISVLYHLSGTYSNEDVKTFVYRPVTTVFDYFRNHPMVTRPKLNNFGKQINGNSYWLVQNEIEGLNKEDVLIFFHGGGFSLNMFETQFMGILALYHAIPESHRSKISIVVVDYSLTCNDKRYPTQIEEGCECYKDLLKQGYTNLSIIGDSAGGNLALAINRIISYPQEAKAHFSKFQPNHFTSFDWTALESYPQPKSLILISPWVEPVTKPELPLKSGVDTTGDLGAQDITMGEWYLGDLSREEVNNFVSFTNTSFKQWDQVSPLLDQRRNLVIYGEREVLRDGIEKWIDITNGDSNGINHHLQKGGTHDELFYIESWDFVGERGHDEHLDFSDKFSLDLAGKFLADIVDLPL
ncbi:Arylacetamide deacetylase [Hyphopichia burtonii NRRL Y-1933]|uniref:Arylacetamide deacetylase n=1 Tax=Hyphopichia burtonii NRRL Y-1933 TaxID=984485 RepID=A0A1E4RG56_9ASCO|nr:Arylacetamide deacetylase [Hyphopichia burtonii NRRL Y-1933]ODV66115.1 Arylacetamide deacetylase [Hyphopichia burtonii NRRL Y-1933]